MQIEYHISVLRGDAEQADKRQAIEAINQLVRKEKDQVLGDEITDALLAEQEKSADPQVVREIAAVLTYAARTKGRVQLLLHYHRSRPEQTAINAGILEGAIQLMVDEPDMSDEATVRWIVSYAHQYIPQDLQTPENERWLNRSLRVFAFWIAAKMNQFRRQQTEKKEDLNGAILMTPFRKIEKDEWRYTSLAMRDIIGEESLRAWATALFALANNNPGTSGGLESRMLLSLLPIAQRDNTEHLQQGVVNVLQRALFSHREEPPTFERSQETKLAEQMRESSKPALEYLDSQFNKSSYVFLDDGLGGDEEYAQIGNMLVALFRRGSFSHIALPIPPERQKAFARFMDGRAKSAKNLFDDAEWAIEHFLPLLKMLQAHGVPLILVGGNPALEGELLCENEAGRFAQITRDDPRAKVLVPTIGYLSSSAGSQKSKPSGPASMPSLVQQRIGRLQTSSMYLLAHHNAWSEEGPSGEIGKFCSANGFYEPFGFDVAETLLAEKLWAERSDGTYGQAWDAIVVFTEKRNGGGSARGGSDPTETKKIRAPRETSPALT